MRGCRRCHDDEWFRVAVKVFAEKSKSWLLGNVLIARRQLFS
jgi:hypothetical protein